MNTESFYEISADLFLRIEVTFLSTDNLKESKMIKFRETTIEDVDFVFVLEQHSDSRDFIIPWTTEQHLDAIRSRDQLHIIVESSNNQAVGYIILSGLTNRNSCIELVRINIAIKGKGFGKESIKLIQDYVFNDLNAHRLWLDVKEHNTRAKHVYELAGFKVEGILRECIKKEESYESLIIMGQLKHEYR
ncbi:hypothetical protein PAECIP112173_05044 [Paenibacillus sp. JJ-100]|uniref:GNAT family N-acetyltransferase n=1 Tax=Paenibacillus sp. JJ-100 TaxID=2974896 RepID=UPI0022FF7B63|nr:GNAT family protein [Paenibacillus sp. JJ-100]CAI6086585.1 hypothetical protein PAECIP112173_05044 [Paenibacillus sp. JJ-100]